MRVFTGRAILSLEIFICLFASNASTAQRRYTPFSFGAKADTVLLLDGMIAAGSSAFSSKSATFTARDRGKPIVISGAGISGNALVTTIAEFVSSHDLKLASIAYTTAEPSPQTYYGTDDWAAINSCVKSGISVGGYCTITDGKTFMVSNDASTIVVNGPVKGAVINGSGTIVFAPKGQLTGARNDRLFYLASTEGPVIQISTGRLTHGSTSFTVQNAAAIASWAKDDWLLIMEHDSGIGDVVYVDWVQVADVSGTTVKIKKPLRMTFPNAREWATTGSSRKCTASFPCGLGAVKVANIVQNVTLRDFTIIIPRVIDTNKAIGIALRSTRGTQIKNVHCFNLSQNCVAAYRDQGLVFKENHIVQSAAASEFAANVDFRIIRNEFNKIGESAFAPCLEVDFGSGFGRVTRNKCSSALNAGIDILYGVHDSYFAVNNIDWVSGQGSGILSYGSYDCILSGNTLAGGSGTGIVMTDASLGAGLNVSIADHKNVLKGNIVGSFSSAYVINGTSKSTRVDGKP
jgi:hypothetical protein